MTDEELTRRFDAIDKRFDAIDERFATKSDLRQMSTEIRNHFDLVAESFKAEIRVVAEGHRALRATDAALIEAWQRLEKGQDRLELRQLAVEIRRRTPESE